MARHRLVVFTDAKPGCEAEFNEWYDDVHLRDVLEVDGFVAAQRFTLAEAQMAGFGGESAPGRYLALYEIEAEDLASALEKLSGSADRMVMSDAMDAKRAKAWAYSALGERRRAS